MTTAGHLVRPLPVVPRSPGELPSLHRRQVEVLRAIADYRRTHPCPPTLREIARAIHCRSLTPVDTALLALHRKGLVTWIPSKARTLRIIYDPEEEAHT